MSEDGSVTVFVTVESRDEARTIAQALVRERLAACVNVLPEIRSFYWWDGAVQDDPELLLIVKTRADRFADLERRVRELHSYEVPEVIALPIRQGSEPYLDWVAAETDPTAKRS